MTRKPLIVIDTNVLVSGLRSRQGWSFQLISRIGGESFEHCVSAPLVLEYEEVLKREAVSLGLELSEIDDFVDRVAETGRKCLIYFQIESATPDPDDVNVLALAVAARADRIVTFNVRHFPDAARYGISLCTPAELFAEFGIKP